VKVDDSSWKPTNAIKIMARWLSATQQQGANGEAAPTFGPPTPQLPDKVSRADTLDARTKARELSNSIENLESCFEMALLRRKLGDEVDSTSCGAV